MRLKANGNVFVTSSGYAYDACKAASPIHKVSACLLYTSDAADE